MSGVLEAIRVSRAFGPVLALDDVSLSVAPGEVVCLLGDNGAGKSTLIGILSGVHPPTSGEVRLDGEPVRLAAPRDALRRGIATVHQDLALVPLMPVWRNFVLGREPVRGRGPLARLDGEEGRRRTREGLAAFGIEVADPDRPVATLSGGERQSLAIARAAHRGARVLILDEPTAALGVRQSGVVLERVAAARERGLGVLLVTHAPHDAHRVGDRFVVLRHGRVAAWLEREEASPETLGALMRGEG